MDVDKHSRRKTKMRINHNIAALNTYRQLNTASTAQSKSMEKLSSGLRINKAGDDAAGLAISEKMRAQVRGLDQASKNSQDAISLVQTAEGALNETHDILQRMRELSTQAANDTNVGTDRTAIQDEIKQLTSEINRIGNTTEFNTQKLLDGTKTGNAIAGTAGVSTITIGTAFTAGETFQLDGVTFTAGATANPSTNTFAAGTIANQAGNIAQAIQNNKGLAEKYTVTYDDTAGTLTLTQKAGFESATAVNFTESAGTGVAAAAVGTAGVAGTSGQLTMQIGANGGQTFTVDINDMRANSTGTNGLAVAGAAAGNKTASSGKIASYVAANNVTDGTSNSNSMASLDVSTAAKASAAIDVIDDAIKNVSAERSKLGAFQNRLEHTINNLNTSSENLTAAESRIRDVDMAKEMMNQTKNSILSQAAQAMLAQSNQMPQGVLQLLR
jgi:flagellin